MMMIDGKCYIKDLEEEPKGYNERNIELCVNGVRLKVSPVTIGELSQCMVSYLTGYTDDIEDLVRRYEDTLEALAYYNEEEARFYTPEKL